MTRKRTEPPKLAATRRRMGCPPAEDWTLYAGGLLSPERCAVLESHLLACADCATTLVEETRLVEKADYADAPIPEGAWLPAVVSTPHRAEKHTTRPKVASIADWFRDRLAEVRSGVEFPGMAYAAAEGPLVPSVRLVAAGKGAKPRACSARVVTPATLESGARLYLTLRLLGAAAKLKDAAALVVVSLRVPRRRAPVLATCRTRVVDGMLRVSGVTLEPAVEGEVVAVTVDLRRPR